MGDPGNKLAAVTLDARTTLASLLSLLRGACCALSVPSCLLLTRHVRGWLQLSHLGGSLGFYSGNVQELLEDVAELKPHIFVSVPRLWNRIYDKVGANRAAAAPFAATRLYPRATATTYDS